MHDLKTIYLKVEEVLKKHTKEYFEKDFNIQFYPNPPIMTDLEIISLSITAECAQIDSENLLWSKLQKDYSDFFVCLPHRTSFSRRRKRLAEVMSLCLNKLSEVICERQDTGVLIIDSMPIPTCKIVGEHSSKA